MWEFVTQVSQSEFDDRPTSSMTAGVEERPKAKTIGKQNTKKKAKKQTNCQK